MSGATVVAGAVQLGGGVLLAPLLAGTVQQLKARLQGRRGPSPLQPYRDLRRLWGKSTVTPDGASALYRAVPAIVAAAALVALLVVPIAGEAPGWGVGSDALTLLGLLALARFATALSAWDSGSGFALMGASRDLTLAVFAEVALILALLLAALAASGSTDLVAMSDAAAGSAIWREPAHWCAALAFALVALAETGRQPVDNPDTHLELTMIHEGPLLEYAGRDLAYLQWAAAARLWLMGVLAAELFLPAGGSFAARLGELAAALAALVATLALTETVLAKMRILRVPVFLGGAVALCAIGLVSRLSGVFG
jgi:formate hydrogenlyase subunit 4